MKKTPLFAIIMAALFASCVPKTKTVTKTVLQNDTSGTNTGTITSETGDDDSTTDDDNDSTIDYITISDRVVHGNNSGSVVWKSSNSNHTGGIDERAFSSDQKLYIQIIPRRDHWYTSDVNGTSCAYRTLTYSKLKMKIRVASKEAPGQGASCTFSANVDSASDVIQLSVPSGSLYPPVIEISNVEHDYYCNSYCVSGQTSNVTQCQQYYCPYIASDPVDCFAFDIRVATDDTKSLPGTIKSCGE